MRKGLDIDDVLAQFYPAICIRLGKSINRINIWDGVEEAAFVRLNMPLIENSHNFWLNLQPLSRPEDINFDFDYYLTSSPPAMQKYREQWLAMHGFPRKPVIITNNKVETMLRLDIKVLIDDKPSTLEAVQKAGLIAIQFIPPYMSIEVETLNPIRHLSQVKDVLNKIKR